MINMEFFLKNWRLIGVTWEFIKIYAESMNHLGETR